MMGAAVEGGILTIDSFFSAFLFGLLDTYLIAVALFLLLVLTGSARGGALEDLLEVIVLVYSPSFISLLDFSINFSDTFLITCAILEAAPLFVFDWVDVTATFLIAFLILDELAAESFVLVGYSSWKWTLFFTIASFFVSASSV